MSRDSLTWERVWSRFHASTPLLKDFPNNSESLKGFPAFLHSLWVQWATSMNHNSEMFDHYTGVGVWGMSYVICSHGPAFWVVGRLLSAFFLS